MPVKRLAQIPELSVARTADAAGNDPEVLRLENLDTDLPPPADAVSTTKAMVGRDEANSYLPFTGTVELREAVAKRLKRQTGEGYSPQDVVITCGGTEGMFDTLLAVTDPDDEVILTDPTYTGMIHRVRLAGATPILVPFTLRRGEWRLDLEALRAAVTARTRALFIMNPSMPSGAVLNAEEWAAIADVCREHSAWLIYNAAMERILYDGRPYLHPASLPGMAERTITVGSVSKEYRMIGWRIGWVAGPSAIMEDVARVHVYNVVTPIGISQAGACAALNAPDDGLGACVREWQRRRDAVLDQLGDMPVTAAAGGWSMLFDVGQLGYDSATASRLLLEKGKVAMTPMREWGERNSDQFLRIVFSNEPVTRLAELRDRVRFALS